MASFSSRTAKIVGGPTDFGKSGLVGRKPTIRYMESVNGFARRAFRTARVVRLISVHLGNPPPRRPRISGGAAEMATQGKDLLNFAKTAAKSRAGFNEWQTVRNTLGFQRKVRSLLCAIQGTGRADLRSNPSLLLSISGILAFSFFYRYWRPNPHLRALTEVAAQFLLILIFGLLLTYAAAAVKFPYVDADLYAIDNALGFNRHAYLKFFADRPWLSRIVEFAYFSMLPQFALVPVVMFFAKQFERVQRMTIAVAIALLITVLVSVFTPSLTAFVHVDMPEMANVPANLYTPEATMEALRAGTMRSVALNQLEGLISFPSFHTAAALIFIWTLHTVRYVSWAGVPLNLALIVATPTVGAHYFIDVVGGVVVAFAAITASHLLCRRAKADEFSIMPGLEPDLAQPAGASIRVQ
jgi:membrane-associated phospholipid phosphatase